MPAAAKDLQISVRVPSDTDAWLARREREEKLLEMFNEAAAHVSSADLEERESLLGGFAGGETD
ncbi:MAG: hypothetical protein QOH06_439 [Acidobacteriota bacterium]|jgi:hypothetical protein|nr:hypothetical protein [Acidobacteriota bacterium]